jgi:hypothetical protein
MSKNLDDLFLHILFFLSVIVVILASYVTGFKDGKKQATLATWSECQKIQDTFGIKSFCVINQTKPVK